MSSEVPDGTWIQVTNTVVAIATGISGLLVGGIAGLWRRANSEGMSTGEMIAWRKMIELRLASIEERKDHIDMKLDAVGARMADFPSRAEMNQRFDRLENRLESRRPD